LLREITALSKLFKKFTAVSVFKNHEDALVIVKPTVETENVRVTETGLNIHFPLQLMMNVVLVDLFLENHLQCHYVLALHFPGYIDPAELPSP